MTQTTTSQDPWDGIQLSGGQFQKWLEPGDRVFGEVTEVSVGQTVDKEPCPQIVVKLDGTQDEVTITASQAMLKNELLAQRPRVGDMVDIALTGIDTTNGRTLKKFSVTVAPGGDSEVF